MKNTIAPFLILLSLNVISQNLVPNSSFENYLLCPTDQGQIQYTPNWKKTQSLWVNTPDLFNACSQAQGVPINPIGNQQAFEGTGYAGLFILQEGSHEYMHTLLTSPLSAGQDYFVSFYVSPADDFQLSTNNIGALFSVTPLSVPMSGIIAQTPHINTSEIISDVTSWTQISGTYHATGGEQYITFGNFYSDEQTNVAFSNPSGTQWIRSYYYIDMVSVTPTNLSSEQNNFIGFSFYPNPTSDILYFSSINNDSISSIQLINQMGQIVKRFNHFVPYIDMSNLDSGVFILVVSSDSQKVIRKVIKS